MTEVVAVCRQAIEKSFDWFRCYFISRDSRYEYGLQLVVSRVRYNIQDYGIYDTNRFVKSFVMIN